MDPTAIDNGQGILNAQDQGVELRTKKLPNRIALL